MSFDRILKSLLCTLTLALCFPNALAGTIQVDTDVDEPMTVNGNCTCREAIQAANTDTVVDGCTGASGADDIQFMGNYTIVISEGEMSVNTDITLNAISPMAVVLDGNNLNQRAFVLPVAASRLSVDNMTIQNFALTSGSGGAVNVAAADATLAVNTSTFDNNSASAASGNGGAINSNGDLILNNATFTNNSAGGDGGAINLQGSNLSITDGFFGIPPLIGMTGNSAGEDGGAINISVSSGLDVIQLNNVVFFDNSADGSGAEKGGGAIWASTPSDSTFLFLITQGQFLNNTATAGSGGAILATNNSRIAYLDPLLPFNSGISRTHFQFNSAEGPATADGSGGAIYNRGTMTIVSSSFVQNDSTSSSGGAISHNPGAADLELTLANVTMTQNSADTDGGAIANLHASSGIVNLINSTIASNTADETGGTAGGGGIFNNNSTASEFTVTTSIISDNMANGAPENCAGTAIQDGGFNVEWPSSQCGFPLGDPNLDTVAPDLGSLNPLVWVMPLLDPSAAAGAGDNSICGDVLAGPILSLDARGIDRPQTSGNCDSGAYEADQVPVTLMNFSVD